MSRTSLTSIRAEMIRRPRNSANCAADGVPGGAYVQDDWGAVAAYGGNPELEPETGHSSEPA